MEEIRVFAKQCETNSDVKICLENSDKTYLVPRPLLCIPSPYFEKALVSGFEEAASQTLRLPGCDEDTFETFLYWLCHHEFPCLLDLAKGAQVIFVKLWLFADACLIPKLQNKTMEDLLYTVRWDCTDPEAVCLAFNGTSADSKLREALIGEAVHEFSDGEDVEAINKLSAVPGCMASFLRTLETSREDGWLPPSQQKPQHFMVPET